MHHRHLNHEGFTLAAIDDIIARGLMRDWLELRAAALKDRAILEKVQRVCLPQLANPTAQRHYFWAHYAKRHLAAA